MRISEEETGRFYWARNELGERTGYLFSIVAHLPKLDVAGSIPVSRFSNQ
jgi:hypothetical protein